jgi:phosphoglycolate phosphatase-like HAD superfamily hydrolase
MEVLHDREFYTNAAARYSSHVPLLVLDFDGVICDSVEECFVSSWTAYYALHRRLPGGEPPASARAEFRAMRPFVRSGEDFVLIQELIAEGRSVRDQQDFDRAWARPGTPSPDQFKELFYRARTDLLEKDRLAWLSLNRIYPHVSAALSALPPAVPLYILSTKKPQFVSDTLRANGITVPEAHVLYSHGEPKLTTVEKLRETLGYEEVILVEDQIDAIRGNTNPRIRAYLASWGYVQESWLRESSGVHVLSPDDFVELVAAQTA